MFPKSPVLLAVAVEGCPNIPVPIWLFEPNRPPTGAVEDVPNVPKPTNYYEYVKI